MKNRIGFLILFIAFATSAFAQKETQQAMVGTWKYFSVDDAKFNKRLADGNLTAVAKTQGDAFKSLFLNSTIVFNANNTFTVSNPTTVQKGNFSIGQNNAMKYEVNGVVTLFYVEKVSATELVIYADNNSLIFTFKK